MFERHNPLLLAGLRERANDIIQSQVRHAPKDTLTQSNS
jgi:hypothetical protein